MRRMGRQWLMVSLLAMCGAGGSPAKAKASGHHAVAHSYKALPLAQQIDALMASPEMTQAHWGISVTTQEGRVLYAKNDAQLFAPASNAKLFTTAAALALLGPEATVQTRVLAAAPADAAGTLHGDLTLVGAGDASMSGRTYPYDGRTKRPNPPLTALAALADAVATKGVRRVEGNIVGDDTAFPWEPYGAGWAWNDLEWGFGAPVSALTVNDNVADLTIAPGAQPGDPLMMTWDPEVTGSYYTVENTGRTSAAGSQPSVGVDRGLGARTVRIFGTLPAGGAAKHLGIAIQDPAEFAAVALAQMLIQRGISITGPVEARHRMPVDTAIFEQSVMRPLTLPTVPDASRLTAPIPQGAIVLAERTSVPLLEEITVTNKVSQNLHAEILLRLLGRQVGEDGSIEEGVRVVRAFAQGAGIAPGDFFLYDGSGLSAEDKVTPRAVTTLLRYAAAQPWSAQFESTLPIGGVDGTLADRFTSGRLRGRVMAKTGTLDEINALSGYLTAASGQKVVFSILCNGHLPQAQGVPRTIDRIAEAISASE